MLSSFFPSQHIMLITGQPGHTNFMHKAPISIHLVQTSNKGYQLTTKLFYRALSRLHSLPNCTDLSYVELPHFTADILRQC